MKTLEWASAEHSLRRYMAAGYAVVILVVFGLGGWAATAHLAGAVIGQGSVVVASKIKQIQHPTGGVVRSVRVHDGDRVKAGDILIQLDPTQFRATASIIDNNVIDLTARKARLDAERDNLDEIRFPPGFEARATAGDADVGRAIASEQRLFKARRDARKGQKAQLTERREQLQNEISGYTGQIQSKDQEVALIHKELDSVQQLWQQKLTPLNRLVSLQRDATRVEGERGQLTSLIAQSKAKISEINLQILQIDQDLRKEVGNDLFDTQSKLSDFSERKTAADEDLKRVDIRASESGYVHQLTAYTVGGVIKAGEQIMMIVPDHDAFEIEVRIDPHDIEKIHVGQSAELKFSGLNPQTTPEITGEVNFIAADSAQDQRTGQPYYTVHIVLPQKEVAKLNVAKIVPGMPVEAFIQTGERTAMSYIIKPIAEQASRAFKQ